MSENPFDTSNIRPGVEPCEAEPLQAQLAMKPRRPLFVTILAVLYVVGAVVLLGKSLLLLRLGYWEMIRSDSGSLIYHFLRYELRVLLLLAAAVGLWQGRRWGWFLAGFVQLVCASYLGESIYFDLRYIELAVSELMGWLGIFTAAFQALVHLGVFLCLFTPEIVVYCEIQQKNRLQFGALLIALTGAFVLARYVAMGYAGT